MDEIESPRRLLMLTNSELGAANIFLAAIHELLRLAPDLEIHFVSFNNIAETYKNAVEYALKAAPHARPPVFHELDAPNLSQALLARQPKFWDIIAHRMQPNPFTIAATARATSNVFLPWDAKDFVSIYRQLETILKDVQPQLTVIDPCFAPGWTLCVQEKLNHVIFQPNSIKELSLGSQPRGQALWKYPALGSGFPFPVPWYYIPLNIYYSMAFGIFLLTDPRLPQVAKEVEQELGFRITTMKDVVLEPPKVPVLLGCRPEVDFPMEVIPEFLVPCGPIVRTGPSIGETDPALERWLARGRVVYINMGTLKRYTEDEATEMAKALRMLLDKAQGISQPEDLPLQVLWKLKREGDYSTKEGSGVYSILKREIDLDRMRITDWLIPEPSAILESGSVVCSVNHGGASSWYEALCAGIPQVILPVWSDTYEAPHRAQFLGVGCWGNPHSAPTCTAIEAGPALIKVILGPEAAQMQARAKEVAALTRRGGHGRTIAAQEILKHIARRKV